jgi:hypothetical protein
MCEYLKNCPGCGSIMKYDKEQTFKTSVTKNIKCFDCKTFRFCGGCGKKIVYAHVEACITANKKKSLCKSCGIKKSCNTPERLTDMSNRVKGDKNPMYGKTGEKASFYGKHHTEETKNKFREDRIGKPMHTTESKKKISDWQQDNAPMRGKTVYSIWVEKYGVEVADEKMKAYRELQSVNNTGDKNSMYGKPSPNGSGNGYSGWYNEIFFRSLRELMFLIYAKRFNLKLENLEKRKYKLQYLDHDNQCRNYFSDFLVNDKYFVEIKPKRLWGTPKNIIKFQSAKEYCSKNDLKFKLIDPVINSKLLKRLYDIGEIKFMDKYEAKFLEFWASKN